MKNTTALQAAGIVAAGVVAYLVISRTMKAGGDAVKAVKQVIAEDLNPTSDKNLAYRAATALGNSVSTDGQDKSLGARIWEWANPGKVAQENAALGGNTAHVSNTKLQAAALVGAYSQGGPSTGVYALPAPDQSPAEDARLRRAEAEAAAPKYAQNLFDMYYSGNPYNQ